MDTAPAACAALLVLATPLTALQAGTTTLESADSAGVQGDAASLLPALSADGRWLAFQSIAANLVPGDANGEGDVFLRDLATGTTVRVSEPTPGVDADGRSENPRLSAGGTVLAFQSQATNLVPGDTNGATDVFIADLAAGTLSRVSLDSAGAEANGDSDRPALSADGRFVSFRSAATNLVAGDTNGVRDVFVHDRLTGQTRRVSVSSAGLESNAKSAATALSPDGSLVAFDSLADNLVPGDGNAAWDVFVHELATGQTTRISLNALGAEGSGGCFAPVFADGGRLVVFEGEASGLVPGDNNLKSDVFCKDRETGAIELLSKSSQGVHGDNSSGAPDVTPDGRYVAFRSRASNLVPGDGNGMQGWDVFVHDRADATTTRVSVSTTGGDPDLLSDNPAISADGRLVAFDSHATNLVAPDANGSVLDVFLTERALDPWTPLPGGIAGVAGVPQLTATGGLAPGATTTFKLSAAVPGSAGAHVLGAANAGLPLFGGVLVPSPDLVVPLATDAAGKASFAMAWPLGLPGGLDVYVQSWVLDGAAVQGLAATDALAMQSF